MLDPERLLGGLLRAGVDGAFGSGRKKRKRRRKTSWSRMGSTFGVSNPALGMGLLGVAIAAYEHFTSGQTGGTSTTAQMPSGGFGVSSAGAGPSAQSPPPPPPPLPPLPPLPGIENPSKAAILLARAMIAAANADHAVDETERAEIMESIAEAGLSAEERAAIEKEFDSPMSIEALAAEARTPELAEQVYFVSLLAIDTDTDAERNYLARLAKRLGLDAAATARLAGKIEELSDGEG